MLTVRRIYLYLVSAISLIGVTWSVIGLTRLILSEGIGQGQIIGLATWLAVIIVGLPIFLFHWLTAQRLAKKAEEERSSVIRRIYFYVIMGAGAAPIISNVYRLVDNGLLVLLGGTRLDYYPYNLTTAEHAAAVLVWSVVWLYIWRQVQVDNQSIPPDEINLGVRRLYLVLISLVGLMMTSWGAIGLLRTLMEIPVTTPLPTPIANHSAQLLVGGAVWLSQWTLLQRAFLSGRAAEERSVLRKIYLYLAVFVFSVMAVSNATLLLARLIELALGGEPSTEPLLSQLSGPVPFVIVGGILWAYHWQVLQQDADQAPEVPRQASVRRIYAYLVAAIGLAALVGGVGGLLSLLIDLLTTPAEIGLSFYREQVSLFTAMVIVGGPVWLIPWRALQQVAAIPAEAETEESAGVAERRSLVRKIYLYSYVFVAALALFGSVGWFVFHILTALLGADLPDDFITLVLDALVISLLAGGVWWYHWAAIRRDGMLEQAEQIRRLSNTLVVVIDGEAGKLGQNIIRHLQNDLPGLQLEPVGLTPQATEAMAGQPFSTATREVIQKAHYVIGSWQALMANEVAPTVTASPALKLVAPLANHNWAWAGLKQRSADYYARQAARGVKQAIEGEEINPSWELDTSTIISVVIGILIFLLLIAGLIAILASF